jgi:L-ascorbate metabolism protein UlaG (beta-lactamase superfamily)
MNNLLRAGCWRRAFSVLGAMLCAATAVLAMAPGAALATCLPVAQSPTGPLDGSAVIPASFDGALPAQALLAVGTVELSYLGHSSFLIRSPAGASAITDYNGINRAPAPPDIVTMNNAHGTHFTDQVEPGVRHILRGWDPGGGIAVHDLTYLDMHVRNVPTNVRDVGGTRIAGNSIFVFEIAGLCIAHLGHLHHRLEQMHLAELGPIDVLLVPVDGSYTMGQEVMAEVVAQIQPSLVIPMHYFSEERLARFLALIDETYPPEWHESPTVVIARDLLSPRRAIVLPGH